MENGKRVEGQESGKPILKVPKGSQGGYLLEVSVVVAQSWPKGASFKNQFVLSSPTLWPNFLFLIPNKPDSLSVVKSPFSEERVGHSTGLGVRKPSYELRL